MRSRAPAGWIALALLAAVGCTDNAGVSLRPAHTAAAASFRGTLPASQPGASIARYAAKGAAGATGPAEQAAAPVAAGVPRCPWGDRALADDPGRFNRNYVVHGSIKVSYFGGGQSVPPPPTAVSSWQRVIATVFVRGETSVGQLGFSFGFDGDDMQQLRHLILFVPASRDPAHPADGYIDMPLREGVAWLGSGGRAAMQSLTIDGQWIVRTEWMSPHSLRLAITTAPGRDSRPALDHGTLDVTAAGPVDDAWRALTVNLSMHGRATVTGHLVLTPA